MNVYIIDPWCYDGSNLYYYTTGLASGIGNHVNTTIFSACPCSLPENANYKIIPIFFKKSNGMNRSKLRTIIRGLEYIYAYLFILYFVRKNRADIIHVEWPLMYRLDAFIFKILKKEVKKFILTAHNVLPHSTGTRYYKQFEKIYSVADKILVHGDMIKQEFVKYYPEHEVKVKIQHHGLYMNHDKTYMSDSVDSKLRSKIESAEKVYLVCGFIHYDKGIDRIIDIWDKNQWSEKSLLVIAGKVSDDYNDFSVYRDRMKEMNNLLFIEGYASDNLLNFLIDKANLVILPYRKGSMSGVVFTCAQFSTPLLCTEFGAIKEYLMSGDNSFIVHNTDAALCDSLKYIDEHIGSEEMRKMGARLKRNFENTFEWDAIGKKVVNEIYEED